MNVEIKKYLKNPVDVQEGIALFRKYGNNSHFVRLCELNPSGNKKMLLYQLSKLAGTTKSNSSFPSKKVAAKAGDESPKVAATFVPVVEKKFRDQYPFLSLSDCPQELKILAADKITAWRNYTSAHKELFNCDSVDIAYNVSRSIIENYKQNRLIFKELDYYNKHKKVLGKHPVFDRFNRFKQYASMDVVSLVKLMENTLPDRIWRIKSEIKKGNKPHLLSERTARLAEYENDLIEIKRLLRV